MREFITAASIILFFNVIALGCTTHKWQIGDKVTVTKGHFAGCAGTIEGFDPLVNTNYQIQLTCKDFMGIITFPAQYVREDYLVQRY